MGFLVYTGLRREEIMGLCWDHIHLEEGYGEVKQVVVYPGNKQAEKKDLRKQINETTRKERNARLYFRDGELTYHLQAKAELLTDEDIELFLNYVFSFNRTQKLVSIAPQQKDVHRETYRQRNETL